MLLNMLQSTGQPPQGTVQPQMCGAVPRLRNCLVTVYSLAKQRLCVEHVTEKDTLAAGHRFVRIIPFFF